MPHTFRNAEYADMMYVYGFCDGSATAAVEEYSRQFPMDRILDCRVFYMVFNTLRECSTLPSAHVSSERACKRNMGNRKTFLMWYSVVLQLSLEEFQHLSVFHEHMYGKNCMKTTCSHFTHSLCKIYTQGIVSCI